jgi:hypothetical protein
VIEGFGGAERWRGVYVVVVGGVDGMGVKREREKVTWEKRRCPWSNVSEVRQKGIIWDVGYSVCQITNYRIQLSMRSAGIECCREPCLSLPTAPLSPLPPSTTLNTPLPPPPPPSPHPSQPRGETSTS